MSCCFFLSRRLVLVYIIYTKNYLLKIYNSVGLSKLNYYSTALYKNFVYSSINLFKAHVDLAFSSICTFKERITNYKDNKTLTERRKRV